ncbi:MAG: hypothetical protein QG597_3355 [Actinomycetota bacterium]|nr:hypothetical protein [Actinomycetota bacterium]
MTAADRRPCEPAGPQGAHPDRGDRYPLGPDADISICAHVADVHEVTAQRMRQAAVLSQPEPHDAAKVAYCAAVVTQHRYQSAGNVPVINKGETR